MSSLKRRGEANSKQSGAVSAGPRLLSPAAVFLLGVNSIIGSGIFLLSGQIYQAAGVYSLLAIVLAGLSILVIAFSYARMSRLYPEDGGAFIYAKQTFGRFPGFIVGALTWLLGVVTVATEVSALLTALQMVVPALPSRLLGPAVILLLGIVSYFSSSLLAGLDNLTSLVKILIVVGFIALAVGLVRFGNFWQVPTALGQAAAQAASGAVVAGSSGAAAAVSGPGLLTGLLSAYGTVYFFFTGFSFLPVNAEKMRNPSKTLPRMMTAVMLTVILAYLAIQAISIGVLGNRLPVSTVPAATIVARVIGPVGVPLLVIAIGVSIFGVIVAASFNTPTILASLALAHEDVPLAVAAKNRFGTPTVAVVLSTLAAIGLFLSGNYAFLAGLTVFMSFVQYLSTGLATTRHRGRGNLPIGLGTILFSLVLLASFTLPVLALGVGIMVVLSLVYLIVKVDDEHLEEVRRQRSDKIREGGVN